ncbi:MAG: universal stress protein [Gemmatimonadaceae bacterium]|nr:universal stress protein [Gemmatimonadaceae bacterium]
MYKTILVPVDGSDFSARALPVAVELARRTGAMVHLALVHDPSAFIPFVPGEVAVPLYDSAMVRERREADQAILDRTVAALTASGVRVTGVLLEGTVIESLVEYGQQVASELTVMTTHGRGGFARLRLGSVATAYLTRSTTPVLLVHGAGGDAGNPSLPALPSGTLLCPLDGSPFAEQILPHAAGFADACGMRLKLFSVTTPHAVAMAPFATESLLADPTVLEQEEHDRAAYLTRLAAGTAPGTLTNAVTDMAVGRAILEEAAASHAGAIAMATHGRSGIARVVLGSVADEVIRHSSLPLLVYRPGASK